MANIHAAQKAMRRSSKLQARNRRVRSRARSEVKQAAGSIATGNIGEAEKSTLEAIRALDDAAQKGIIKKNNAARRKSRLMKKLNALRATKK